MLDGNVLLRQKRDEVPEGTLSCPDRNLAVFHHYRHYEGLRLLPSVYDSKLIQQTLINYVYGFQMLLANHVVQRFKSYNNHFTSLIESCDSTIQTAFYWDHRYSDMFVDIINVKTKPLWMELLHGKNVANGFCYSYTDSCFWGYLLFTRSDFGYKQLKVSLCNTVKKMFSKDLIVNRLRSYKHELLKI